MHDKTNIASDHRPLETLCSPSFILYLGDRDTSSHNEKITRDIHIELHRDAVTNAQDNFDLEGSKLSTCRESSRPRDLASENRTARKQYG